MMKNLIQCLVLTIFPATYYIQQTTTISNCKTLTAPPVTRVTTKTHCDQVLTQNETITKLVEKSTTIDFTSTTTLTPTCRVSDRVCSLPASTDEAMPIRRRMLICAPAAKPSIRKRAPDTSAHMVFATAANATTVTVTASPITQRNIITGTVYVPITISPQTVPGAEVVKTVTAPGSTPTVNRDIYTTMYVTKTFTRATSTTTAIDVPPAVALECQENGGVLEI